MEHFFHKVLIRAFVAVFFATNARMTFTEYERSYLIRNLISN